jgi:epsilon-lactone hydrolase
MKQGSQEDEAMPAQMLGDTTANTPWLVVHPASKADLAAENALRSSLAPFKGMSAGTAARGQFDEVMERVVTPPGVTFEPDTVGGIAGWWAKPARRQDGVAVMHVHGGWFNLGSARAYRNFAGHIASSVGADAFIPEYRLAPEHPFPAAVRDVGACYRGLVDRGITRIAVTGDSAGGNLALVLLQVISGEASDKYGAPVGVVAMSPVTDLALTGDTFETRADADPYFTKSQAAALVASYLGETDPKHPLASALYGHLRGLPPIRVHVGDDEVLLDDSRRYVKRAVAAGVDAQLDVWMGMPHGFVANVGQFSAAEQALGMIGAFLSDRLADRPGSKELYSL